MMKFTRASIVFLVPILGCFLALLSPCSAAPSGLIWTNVSSGLSGAVPVVGQLAIDRVTGTTFYALTSGGLFKSTDSGSSWTALGTIAGVNVIALDPTASSTVYAGTAHGVVKTTDGGASWVSAGISDTSVGILAVDPITPSKLYAGGNGHLYKSADRGGSWTELNLGPPPGTEGLWIAGLAVDPLTPSTLYVALGRGAGGDLIKSVDGGASWNVIYANAGPFYSGSPLVIDPSTPSTLYRINPLQKSTDGGATWTPIGFTQFRQCVGFSAFAIDPTNPNTAYGATGINACDQMSPAIFKSTDGGQSWNAVDTIIPAAASFTFSPDASTIFAATGGGIFKSTDGGLNWGETNAGLRIFDIEALVGDPINPSTVYAGGNEGLFKSVDSGANWTHPYTLSGADSLLINFRNSNILYARKASPNGCSSGEIDLHKSTDGGSSWNELEPDAGYGCGDGGTMAMDPADPNTLYVVYGNDYDGFTIFKTTDGGTHWVNLYPDALGSPDQINALVIDPNTPAILYAPTDIGVFRSTDGGTSFTPAGFANTRVLLLAIDPVRSNILYAATSNNDWASAPAFQGLYKSTDSGTSWSPINQGLDEIVATHPPVNALLVDADRPNILYLATSGYGVFKSSDGGATWAAFNSGLTNLDVRSLALVRPGIEAHQGRRPGALSSDTLYAGTPGGVFKIR